MQIALSLSPPPTVLVRWAQCSPTWPMRADTPCVRGSIADGVRREMQPAGRVVRLEDLSVGEHAWIYERDAWRLVARDDRRDA